MCEMATLLPVRISPRLTRAHIYDYHYGKLFYASLLDPGHAMKLTLGCAGERVRVVDSGESVLLVSLETRTVFLVDLHSGTSRRFVATAVLIDNQKR